MLTQAQKQQIAAKVEACYVICDRHYNRTFRRPSIAYDLRGGTAGQANARTNHIRYNPTLAAHNFEDFLARTVPHEVAHLIDFEVNNKMAQFQAAHQAAILESRMFGIRRKRRKVDVHGPSWRAVMRILGVQDVTRCHKYDTTVLGNRHEYACSCGQTLAVGPKHHKAIQRGATTISHKGCGRAILASMLVKAAPAAPARAAQVPATQTPGAPRVGSKLDRAVQIVATHGNASKEYLVALLMRDLTMSKAGATTYYYEAKKRC